MTSSIKKSAIILFILSTLSQPLSAVPSSNLIIKPSVCMVKNPGDSCQMTVSVQWQNDDPIDACLYQNDARLTCWQNAHNINTKIDISLEQDMLFTLKNGQEIFASQQIKINTALPTKYRRRLRADWSFF